MYQQQKLSYQSLTVIHPHNYFIMELAFDNKYHLKVWKYLREAADWKPVFIRNQKKWPTAPSSKPFKDQKSADVVKKQLSDLSMKIDHTPRPVFRSHKICEDLKMHEPKPPLINQQRMVYNN